MIRQLGICDRLKTMDYNAFESDIRKHHNLRQTRNDTITGKTSQQYYL